MRASAERSRRFSASSMASTTVMRCSFPRDLAIEGDTEAVVALRNAIDDSELDLAAEAAELLGPLKPFLDPPMRRLLPFAERLSGVALTRATRPAL